MKKKILLPILMLVLCVQASFAGISYCSETFIPRYDGGYSDIYWTWNSVTGYGSPSYRCCDFMTWIEVSVVDVFSGAYTYYDYEYYGGPSSICFYYNLRPSCCCPVYYGGSVYCQNF